MSRPMSPEYKKYVEKAFSRFKELQYLFDDLHGLRMTGADKQIVSTVQSAFQLLDLRNDLIDSIENHRDYKHHMKLEMRDLENRNRRLQEQVNTLTGDIEKAKKESGLFIKYVRKMMGSCDGQ